MFAKTSIRLKRSRVTGIKGNRALCDHEVMAVLEVLVIVSGRSACLVRPQDLPWDVRWGRIGSREHPREATRVGRALQSGTEECYLVLWLACDATYWTKCSCRSGGVQEKVMQSRAYAMKVGVE